MAGRTRTTKKLAQRIDLNYFKRVYTIPLWRRLLSVILVVFGLLWLGLFDRQRAFNAGPLSQPHALLARDCAACHVRSAGFSSKVTDQACSACHDGPVHQARQTFTPACADCHVEHRGSFRLAVTRDQACTQCHADLKAKDGPPKFAASITGFNGGHPEFAPLRDGFQDPGTIKFGHEVHLKKGLRSATGTVQLVCADCHTRNGALMAPVNFEKHCSSCHALLFDQRFTIPAPHKEPDVVLAFVTKQFTDYIAAHPDEVHRADPSDPRILRPPLPPAKDAAEWISRRVEDTKQLLWRKSCKECHSLNFATPAALPEVPRAHIASRWLNHAEFDHQAHQMLVCTECHGRASSSRETSDVLLPGIATCQKCHRGGSDSAAAGCSECHVYHDWSKEKPVDGKFKAGDFH